MNSILFNNPNYDKDYIKHITNHDGFYIYDIQRSFNMFKE